MIASRIARQLMSSTLLIAYCARELDVGVLERLLEAVSVLHDLSRELLATPREIANLLDVRRWHEAATDEVVREQVGQPHRIVESDLRPGTFLTCCALASTSSNDFSSTCDTRFQYTPVASMTPCVHPCFASQCGRLRAAALHDDQ